MYTLLQNSFETQLVMVNVNYIYFYLSALMLPSCFFQVKSVNLLSFFTRIILTSDVLSNEKHDSLIKTHTNVITYIINENVISLNGVLNMIRTR